MKVLVLTDEYHRYNQENKYEYRILPGSGYINYACILDQLDLSQYDAVFINPPSKNSNLLLTNSVLEWKIINGKANEEIYIHNKNNLLFTSDIDSAKQNKFYNRTLAQYNLALKRNHWQLLSDVAASTEIPIIDQAGKLLCDNILNEAGLLQIQLNRVYD